MDAVAAGAAKCLKAMQDTRVRQATCYLQPKLVVKVTRRHKPRKGNNYETTVLTFGRPNYAERAFLAKCCKAGEPLPVKKVQLKLYKEVK